MQNGERLIEEALTRSIIGAFYTVYRKLGFGFLESIYARAMEKELIKRGHHVQREVYVAVFYDGQRIGWHRIDMLVDGKVVLELKSTEQLTPTARRQHLSCLTATHLQVGLLLHFGPIPKFYRVVYTGAEQPEFSTSPRLAVSADSAASAEVEVPPG